LFERLQHGDLVPRDDALALGPRQSDLAKK
jgi:hypothetical protein